MNEADHVTDDFASWIDEMQAALRGERTAAVPCNGCTACCTSSQFVHLGPDESDTLVRVPAALRFPAPGLRPGHVVLGYDERGHCPMLVDNRCSIYEHRPRTCRTYDCRVFPAAGIELDDDDKALITQRAREWRFTYTQVDSRDRHDAARRAATFLDMHRDDLPRGLVPTNTTQLAVLAIEVHDLFLDTEPGVDRVRDVISSRRGPTRRSTGW
jgi:Fe-S-cluster containining protein